MADSIEQQFKETYKFWCEAPIQMGKFDCDFIQTTNADNPMFQIFAPVSEDLQSERHKAWKKYVVARNRLVDFYHWR
jgi:Txe/YoeB family toxin of Txe-Axe toxin-antitoxin module